ncbi:MAG: hypothetical protein COY81_02475 [Candidatus Pacebacteria bacterium CG_4_10_14_0_8_um_filter_43_12]|nr:MAG: hypothetical protein COY81_02475 [Candidatus Pacebacteria bacterium CG_4_10_14_0_8_um_filter_43_12]
MTAFFEETLPPQTRQLVSEFQRKPLQLLTDFYLSGGTGLALQLGHRQSDDLDFFSSKEFNPSVVEQQLANYGQLEQTELEKGTLNTFLNGVKLQFLEYPYPLLESTEKWQQLQISSTLDIACTKLQTISMRGSKKDFVDLYFLLESYSLAELLNAVNQKYAAVNYNRPHILKSLLYFEDADSQPMPRMLKQVSWGAVREKITLLMKSLPLD